MYHWRKYCPLYDSARLNQSPPQLCKPLVALTFLFSIRHVLAVSLVIWLSCDGQLFCGSQLEFLLLEGWLFQSKLSESSCLLLCKNSATVHSSNHAYLLHQYIIEVPLLYFCTFLKWKFSFQCQITV